MDLQKTIDNLRANWMMVDVVEDGAAALAFVKNLLPMGACVSSGGSATLAQSGILDLIKGADYNYIRPASDAVDYYFCSSNAVTEGGELYNVDGHSSRVSPVCCGPKHVVMVVSVNKIVPDLAAAVHRVKSIAAPMNTKQLDRDTPCHKTGVCQAITEGKRGMTDGCMADSRICCSFLVSAKQRIKDRMHVIFVREQLGF